ncbi:MAG: helicase HerA domain-containing protein [Haloferacaceae archaeon]
MSEKTITVADVSPGPGGDGTEPGAAVSLPVVEILTGRGFITGKSGSGKSNTASVVVEKLLEHNFPVLVVDTDGEYYGLKEEFELLHAGADEECDIRVSPEHAERLAGLALEGNVPIILDVSGYLDEDVAEEIVLETARHLFAKEKKLKKPFLMLVEECHEFVPEGGGLGEAGKMLVKISKRGRKHGLGIVGISQRPANVKKDFITQCDWLVWHRLTWDNDTKVVRRIIDREHADAVEDLDDGEAFLMTDWSESVRRVQFRRKRTFDAGATPGLDDFERPELKSVDGDLVDELREISEERERRESELADLRTELEEKEARIRELEQELERARDLKRMADRFSQALLGRAEAPYRDVGPDADASTDPTGEGSTAATGEEAGASDGDDAPIDERPPLSDVDPWPDPLSDDGATEGGDPSSAEAGRDDGEPETPVPSDGENRGDAEGSTASTGDTTERSTASTDGTTERETTDGTSNRETDDATPAEDGAGAVTFPPSDDAGEDRSDDPSPTGLGTRRGTREALVEDLTGRVAGLDDIARGMLRHYRSEGPTDPVSAHLAAGGDADRELAYSRTRTLRRAGLVTHAERGEYAYALPELVREEGGGRLEEADLAAAVEAVEASFVELEAEDSVDDAESDEVEFVAESGDGSPAFRDDDAEFVDEAELVEDETPDPPRDRAGDAGADDEAEEEAMVMEETTVPSDGLTDRSEEPRDAEFVE